MSRRLFCQLGPWAYSISVCKGRALRHLKDALSPARFARQKAANPLPVLINRHASLIRRTLGKVDPRLQENKAINLALSAPRVNGILIRPGETFSFWHLVGPCSARRGYQEGLTISCGTVSSGTGGGMCQFTNLIHWMVLHTPLTIVEHHHHDGIDLFPDFGRTIPFGTGTSIMYNYLDYRFRNDTALTFQLLVHVTQTHLCGELRCSAPLPVKYHISAEHEQFRREADGQIYRLGEIWRTGIDRSTGLPVLKERIKVNHARVLYDYQGPLAESPTADPN